MTRVKKIFIEKIYPNIGVLYQTFIRTIFPLVLVFFYKDKLDIGLYGEFIAFKALVLPFVSLGQFNIYIIDNKQKVNNEKTLIYFLITLLISTIFFLIENKFISNNLFIIFLPFSLLELIRNQNLVLFKKTKELFFYETVSFAILIYPFIFIDKLTIELVIIFKVLSVIVSSLIFFILILKNTKHRLKINLKDILYGLSFVPNKMITNSVDYILLTSSLKLGQDFQNNYYYLRKIAGIPQLFLSVKNSVLLRESYKNAGIKILKHPFSYLPYLFIGISLILMFFNFNLSSIIIHLSILDLCIGINYYIFLNKKIGSLYIINIIPIFILLINFIYPNLFYTLIIIYAATKFILSYYLVKKSIRKLV